MTAQPNDVCEGCGLARREHHHDGAAYGICGKFIELSRFAAEGALDINSVADSTGEKTGTHGASKETGGHSRGGLTPASTLSPKPAPDAMRPDNCPRCGSSAPHMHPAVQHEGEVELCTDEFHLRPTNQNTPKYIAAVEAKRALSAPVPPADGAGEIAKILNARASDYRRNGGKLFTGFTVAEDFDTNAETIRALSGTGAAEPVAVWTVRRSVDGPSPAPADDDYPVENYWDVFMPDGTWGGCVAVDANDARRNLIKASALIVAEIERLDRAAAPPPASTAGEV